VGIVCAMLGSYVVLRGMAFLGDALAHAILPGIVVAYLVDWPLSIGALVMGVLAATGMGALSRRMEIKEDTAIGIIFAGTFALGVALLSTVRTYTQDLAHFLFGNPLGVAPEDLWLSGALGVIVVALILLFYKEFLILSFDPTLGITLRLPAGTLNYLMLIMMAMTVVVSLQAVGVALVVAMLVTPAASAYLLTRRLPSMMAVSVAIGASSGLLGIYGSYYWNVATGPAVVLVCTGIFLLALVFSPKQGLLGALLRRNGRGLSRR